MKTDKKGNVTFSMMVQGVAVSANVTIRMVKGTNKCTATVSPNFNSNRISFTGYLYPSDQSNVFKGRAIDRYPPDPVRAGSGSIESQLDSRPVTFHGNKVRARGHIDELSTLKLDTFGFQYKIFLLQCFKYRDENRQKRKCHV